MLSIGRKMAGCCRRIKKGIEVICFPNKNYIYNRCTHDYHTLSFSQEGEDLVLASLLEDLSCGFYIDIGAHHPQRFSNTYYFYLRGWQGINIDAMPGAMETFRRVRPRDISLELAVAGSNQVLTYYAFEEPALSTFSKSLAERYQQAHHQKLLFKREIATCTLAEILDRYLPPERTIDFLTIDVEGLDYQVLASNDWQKYRPRVVLVEDHSIRGRSLPEVNELATAALMRKHAYQLFSRTLNTLFFSAVTPCAEPARPAV
jgi:FkbM family methyltransferase